MSVPCTRTFGRCVLWMAAMVFAVCGAARTESQPLAPHAAVHSNGGPACNACHTCAKPTADNLCMRNCTRGKEMAALKKKDAPSGVILLDMLFDVENTNDLYGPVPFDHSGHANWAEIAGGCPTCHHYTPEGTTHPACRTCHEISYKHEDLAKPGLKGAYHRQCLGCHREWSHETKCETCHTPRVAQPSGDVPAAAITEDDVMGRMHSPITVPPVEVYTTNYPKDTGSRVFFHHERHSRDYNFKCAECHRGDSCERCHEPNKQHIQKVRTLEEHHRPCSTCHKIDDACSHCHRLAGEPEPKAFTHESTGWPLGPFHSGLSCRTCHPELKFTRPNHDCNTCHESWDSETFDHSVTGQALNETHASFDCEECHSERDFTQPPSCSECHDEEDGISFPKRRPGPYKPRQ